MHYSIHPPSPYLQTHWPQLLPDWQEPVRSLLIMLQQVPLSLRHRTRLTEVSKDQLRQRVLGIAHQLVKPLQQQGYEAEVFDPCSGLPLFSQAGSLKLDHVAVVQVCLHYPVVVCQGCRTVLHPQWGSAVYPSILVSSAPPAQLRATVPLLPV